MRKTNHYEGSLDVNELVEIHNKYMNHIPFHNFLGENDAIKINVFSDREEQQQTQHQKIQKKLSIDLKNSMSNLNLKSNSFLGSSLSSKSKK